jgi:predicted DNA-binding protein
MIQAHYDYQEANTMGETKQTTIRFGETLYRRLELASERTGLPINSIVIVACMDWLEHREPDLAYARDFPKKRRRNVEDDEAENETPEEEN